MKLNEKSLLTLCEKPKLEDMVTNTKYILPHKIKVTQNAVSAGKTTQMLTKSLVKSAGVLQILVCSSSMTMSNTAVLVVGCVLVLYLPATSYCLGRFMFFEQNHTKFLIKMSSKVFFTLTFHCCNPICMRFCPNKSCLTCTVWGRHCQTRQVPTTRQQRLP